jgi:XRE family transcriptional regulator, regulator of sulfur utilization
MTILASIPVTAARPDADPGRAFGRAARSRRLARGWTTARLAAEAGISLAAVYSVETGRYSPGLSVAWRIAGALEASIDVMTSEELHVTAPGAEAACRHCRRPILACGTLPPHGGCSSGYGWIHAEPHWGHSCRGRSGTTYARPRETP